MTIVILGGGLAGLTAAYYLTQEGIKNQSIHIIEANDRTGGWIQSWNNGNGSVIELGPRTIRGRGKSANNTYNLIRNLGIEELVRNVGINASARYIYANGNIHKLPMSVWKALFTVNQPFTKPWIYYVLRECFTFNNNNIKKFDLESNDENAYDFFCRTYGKEFADYLISPLLCGVSGGNAKDMSVQFMFGSLYEAERKHGSVGLGLLKEAINSYWNHKKVDDLENTSITNIPSVYYLEGGLQQLINALTIENKLQGVDFKLNTRCTELHFHEDNNCAEIVFSNGQQLKCEHVISALPGYKLASLFCSKSQHSKLTQLLTSIPMTSIVTVNLSYDDPNVMGHYKGFGVLSSPLEQLSLLGIIFNSYIYGRNDNVDLTVMMGGYCFDKHFVKNSKCISEVEIARMAEDHVKRVLSIQSPPNVHSVRILDNCIPQYTVGHYQRVKKIQEYITGKRLPITLVGSSYHGISINDVIYTSMSAIRKFNKFR